MTYREFWSLYLAAHTRPATRTLHYLGSTLVLAAIFVGVGSGDWRWLALAPVIGYGCAWAAHFGIEGNRPQTFGHPLWSLLSDYRMLFLALTGRLQSHLNKRIADQS